MAQAKQDMGSGSVKKLMLQLMIPAVVAQVVNLLYNIVDRIYIGHIPGDGSLALTGVGVCLPIIMIISAFSAFVSSGGAPRASPWAGGTMTRPSGSWAGASLYRWASPWY